MKLPQYNKKNLVRTLELLSKESQLGFGAACCERILPNYLSFQNEQDWGNIEILRFGLGMIWKNLEGCALDSLEVNSYKEKIDALAPESEDYESVFVGAAQDACFAICCLLDAFIQHSSERIAQTAEYATDSVDLFVQVSLDLDPNHPNLEETIVSNPLMQQELMAQDDDLKIVSSSGNWILELSNRWRDKGKGNLTLFSQQS